MTDPRQLAKPTSRKRRRRLAWILILAASLLGGSVAHAIAALNVSLPLPVAAGTFTKATSNFTNQFDDVRVRLHPWAACSPRASPAAP